MTEGGRRMEGGGAVDGERRVEGGGRRTGDGRGRMGDGGGGVGDRRRQGEGSRSSQQMSGREQKHGLMCVSVDGKPTRKEGLGFKV